jgi:ribosomal protein S8
MKKKIVNLTINEEFRAKSGLTNFQYLLLAYLREDTNITFTEKEKIELINPLEKFGYLRIIDDEHIVIDSKTELLFESEYTFKARNILTYYNRLKKEHFNIYRRHKALKYIKLFKRLLVDGYEEEYIKQVLEYLFKTWKGDSFWETYLFSIDTIVTKFDKYSGTYDLYLNSKDKTESKNEML